MTDGPTNRQTIQPTKTDIRVHKEVTLPRILGNMTKARASYLFNKPWTNPLKRDDTENFQILTLGCVPNLRLVHTFTIMLLIQKSYFWARQTKTFWAILTWKKEFYYLWAYHLGTNLWLFRKIGIQSLQESVSQAHSANSLTDGQRRDIASLIKFYTNQDATCKNILCNAFFLWYKIWNE